MVDCVCVHERTAFEREHLESVQVLSVGIFFSKYVWLTHSHDLCFYLHASEYT